MAAHTGAHFISLYGTTAGLKEIRETINLAKERRSRRMATLMFVDEFHRWSRVQQEALLGAVEDGALIFVGATTEHPGFSIVGALRSRLLLIQLQPLTVEHVCGILVNALNSPHGLGTKDIVVDGPAMATLCKVCGGDSRRALNALELAVTIAEGPGTARTRDGAIHVSLETVNDAVRHVFGQYDKAGDVHYDVISAFIKSVRGSAVDGALYWLGVMLHHGEDPAFIARRLVISAGEDVGLGDPSMLVLAEACQRAVETLGMPEARIPLATCTVALCRAPKSCAAYASLDKVMGMLKQTPPLPVPMHLRNAPTGVHEAEGAGKDYRYPHGFGGYVEQQYLPEGLEGTKFLVETALPRPEAAGGFLD